MSTPAENFHARRQQARKTISKNAAENARYAAIKAINATFEVARAELRAAEEMALAFYFYAGREEDAAAVELANLEGRAIEGAISDTFYAEQQMINALNAALKPAK